MNKKTFNWTTKDGVTISAVSYIPAVKTRLAFGIVHGLGEYTDRYSTFAERLSASGIAVFTYDIRGHGRSTGPRGHTPNYNLLLEEVDYLVDWMTNEMPETPRFLFGHSMGGNLVINYTLRQGKKIKGSVTTNPWLGLNKLNLSQKLLLNFGKVANHILPQFSINLPAAWFGQTEEERNDKKNIDELIHSKLSARLFFSCLAAGKWALENANRLASPMLVIQGERDVVVSPTATKEFAHLANNNAELIMLDQADHDIHKGASLEVVLKNMEGWLDKKLAKTAI